MVARSASSSIVVAAGSRRSTERPAVDDHDGDAGSVQHALQPRPWQRGLQGDIRSPCLQHAEHGHDLIQRLVDDEADPDFGAGAPRTEVMRQPVRTRVQFGIGQPFLAGDQGQTVGCRADLGLERAVDG